MRLLCLASAQSLTQRRSLTTESAEAAAAAAQLASQPSVALREKSCRGCGSVLPQPAGPAFISQQPL